MTPSLMPAGPNAWHVLVPYSMSVVIVIVMHKRKFEVKFRHHGERRRTLVPILRSPSHISIRAIVTVAGDGLRWRNHLTGPTL